MNYRNEGERLNDLRRGSRSRPAKPKRGNGSYSRKPKHGNHSWN